MTAEHSMSDPSQEPTFEQGLAKLEGIVKQLEDGEISLEQSLKLFEEGVQLSQGLRKQLDSAESKVEILTRKGDGYEPESYSLEQEPESPF